MCNKEKYGIISLNSLCRAVISGKTFFPSLTDRENNFSSLSKGGYFVFAPFLSHPLPTNSLCPGFSTLRQRIKRSLAPSLNIQQGFPTSLSLVSCAFPQNVYFVLTRALALSDRHLLNATSLFTLVTLRFYPIFLQFCVCRSGKLKDGRFGLIMATRS